MGLTGRGGSRPFHHKEKRRLIVLTLFHVSIALGQQNPNPDMIFQYTPTSVANQHPTDPYNDYSYDYKGPQFEVWNNQNATIYPLQAGNLTFSGDFYSSTSSGLFLTLPVPLTKQKSVNVTGRCLYSNPVQLLRQGENRVTSFSSMFQVAVTLGYPSLGFSGTPQGLAFIITSDNSTRGEAGGYRGWLDSTNNGTFAIELDYPQINSSLVSDSGVRVGVILDNRTVAASIQLFDHPDEAMFSDQLSVWIEYNGSSEILEVYVNNSNTGNIASQSKPETPVIVTSVDLTPILSQGGMFVGFSASVSNVTFPLDIISEPCSTSYYVTVGVGYVINVWTFNSDGPPPDIPRDSNGLPTYLDTQSHSDRSFGKSQTDTRILVASVTVPCGLVVLSLMYIIVRLHRRNFRLNAIAKKYEIDPEELQCLDLGPQTFKYNMLSRATKGFSSNELLGSGGFGSVYRGKLRLSSGTSKQVDVAVKRISATSSQGPQEFLAEIKVIGQVQHRNLVRLLGWCHDKGELLLVYEYMPNGSVDQHLFTKKGQVSAEEPVLTWARRLKIVSGVATALAFLHEEWEQRVVHRDVKSSNVMLDSDFNARLGDFGLARLSKHDQAPRSTVVLAGTHGYLAPELSHTRKATEKTDVYSFGVVVLEMATGRRPLLPSQDRRTEDECLLVDWVWGLHKDGNLLEAADRSLQGAYDPREMVTLLKIGLLCCHPNPDERPIMRTFLHIWKGSTPFPQLPYSQPVPLYVWHSTSFSFDTDADDTTVIPMGESGPLAGDRESTHMTQMEDYVHSSIARSGELRQSRCLRKCTCLSTPALRSRQFQTAPLPL